MSGYEDKIRDSQMQIKEKSSDYEKVIQMKMSEINKERENEINNLKRSK